MSDIVAEATQRLELLPESEQLLFYELVRALARAYQKESADEKKIEIPRDNSEFMMSLIRDLYKRVEAVEEIQRSTL